MMRRVLVPGLIVLVLVGAAGGYLAGRGSRRGGAPGDGPTPGPVAQQVYTCSMHPQVRLDGPGTCPICEMPLIPAKLIPGTAISARSPALPTACACSNRFVYCPPGISLWYTSAVLAFMSLSNGV